MARQTFNSHESSVPYSQLGSNNLKSPVQNWDEMIPMIYYFKKVVGFDKKCHFFGMDWGGSRDLDFFLEAAHREGYTNFTYSYVDMSMHLSDNGEYRKLNEPLNNAAISKDVEVYVAFEDRGTRTGTSAVSSYVNTLKALKEEKIPNHKEAIPYLGVVVDGLNISHFHLLGPTIYKFNGVGDYIERKMPNTSLELGDNILSRIPQTISPKEIFMEAKEPWHSKILNSLSSMLGRKQTDLNTKLLEKMFIKEWSLE